MGFSIETGVSAVTVFLQGVLSFFPPVSCPGSPLYRLSLRGARTVEPDGSVRYRRRQVLGNTFFLRPGGVLRLLPSGPGLYRRGPVLLRYQSLFTRAGGILVVLFGLYQLGILGQSRLIASEHRLPFRLDRFTMGPLAALLLGFTFSFAWTPAWGLPWPRCCCCLLCLLCGQGVCPHRALYPGLHSALFWP